MKEPIYGVSNGRERIGTYQDDDGIGPGQLGDHHLAYGRSPELVPDVHFGYGRAHGQHAEEV